MSICQFTNEMCLWEFLRVTIGTCVFCADGIMITNNSNNKCISQCIYVSNHEYDLNEHKSTERNFIPLRFSCLYGLEVSGPEIRHLPANHPDTFAQLVRQWKSTGWTKFELECLLLIFIYTHSKFKVTYKNADFGCQYTRTHTKEKPSKIFNITFAILPFFQKKNTQTEWSSSVL